MWFFHSNESDLSIERDTGSTARLRRRLETNQNHDGDDWQNDDTMNSERREEAVNWRRN
jgi:hypothetical protein